MTGESATLDLGTPGGPTGFLDLQQRHEAGAWKAYWSFETSPSAEGGINVQQLDDAGTLAAAALAGSGDA